MRQQLYEVEKERFYLNDPCRYSICGVLPQEDTIEAWLDGVRLEASLEEKIARSAMERFQDGELIGGHRVEVLVTLPENLDGYKKLEVFAVFEGKKESWFRINVKELQKRRGRPQYYIEEEKVDRRAGIASIYGWAAASSPVTVKIFDDKKQPVDCRIQKMSRKDVVDMFYECPVEEECGFFAELSNIHGRYLYAVMRAADGTKSVHKMGLGVGEILAGKARKYQKRGMDYLRAHGMKALAVKSIRKVAQMRNRPVEYSKWLPKHLPSTSELEKQRKTVFHFSPKISIVVPLYKTKPEYLEQLITSVKDQTYSNWELCLSDGSGADSPLKDLLEKYRQEDARIKVISHDSPLRIAENTNAAIGIATGDYIAFGDHDDVLTADAFFECVKAINADPQIEVLYSDEDKMSFQGDKFFLPHFKPDFNLDLLCTVNYICHLFVAKKELVDRVGLLRPEFDGAQDYDFIFRCVEATSHICHIPRILYHWRSHQDSTAENPESKLYAFDAGQHAVQAHFDRIGVKAEVYPGEFLGLYRTRYIRDYDPLISILIPNKDHIDDLERCISSIEEKSSYRNYEYIIIENNSTEESTFAYYKELEARNPKAHVVYWEGPFNYSDINNFGASYAKGDYLLLLNNDTEVINADWLEELLGYCMRPDVGIVGARLYYEDDTIQHAGVVLGFGGIAGHCFVQQPRGNTGYCHRIICAQDYSAVTAACMMVKKAVFDQVGGLSSDLAVAFNDIDFCLKVRDAGYLVVYNPYAELYHYESKSRGLEDTPEKKERFGREIATLESHWPDIFTKPDPYYNPNLTLSSQDFSLKRL
ncbi:glycosyltransferase family 2 protein [Blautia sp. HCP3S3_G3]|uniref:glycosyltransferase family 2 protein n=1 Tax=Blautia sp. HCP3S3_G3 TaxID=3438913 RepID=UPI003F892A88